MKGKFKKRIIGSGMFVICMAAILLFAAMPTKASDTTDEAIKLVKIENYTSGKLQTEIGNQREAGYLYAGLYKAGTTTVDKLVARNVVVNPNPDGNSTYVAKFVPEGVMGIRAQVSSSLLSNPNAESSSVRFVTAIDSLLYKEVGFKITRIGDDGKPIQLVVPENVTNYVYKELYGVDVTSANPGEPMEYTPKDIHSLAEYFKTYTITGIPKDAYNEELTIIPYWITHDGEEVKGTDAIKSVNLGRSWVYVNSSANAEDSLQFGTRNHPFTKFDDALDAVLLTNHGKIVIQENSDIKTASDFTWKKAEKTRNITITGEDEVTSQLDFSGMTSKKLSIQDGVTFDNMTLVLPQTVFANGHGFKIKDNVVSQNATTSIYGGSEGTSTKGATVAEANVEVYAGSYKEVWGGGKYCTITNDIHVTIKNANIYNETTSNHSRVFGSGANDTVKGNIYVTIGGTFNASHELAGFDSTDHGMYACVHGAGSGTVKGDTFVCIEDEARVDYVYGGGGSNSTVEGTCHVVMNGGKVFSIYGGGKGQSATDGGKNADTSVVMTGGEVYQIMGGNGNGMTGNTYVEIAGGKVHRRIFGGCYNENPLTGTYHITGYSTVVIKNEASVANLSEGMTAGSRSMTEYSDEIAVLICNNDSYTNLKNELITSYNAYDYLVQANAGGVVSSVGTRLSIIPDGINNAVVRLDDSANGMLHAYMTSKGMSTLPELNANTSKREVYVVFGTEQLDAEALSGYEAKVGGTHYDTLENAIAEAKELSDAGETEEGKVTVTLLKDVEIDSVLSVGGAYDILLQSEANNKYSIISSYTDDNVITVYGTLTINNVAIAGGKHGIYVGSSGKVYSTEMVNTKGVSISRTASRGLFVDGGTVDMYNLSVSGTTAQALYFQNNAKATVSKYNVVGTSKQVAVRILSGADVTLNNGTIFANEGYGIYMDGSSSKVKAIDTQVKRATGTNALVGISASTAQLMFEESETGEAYIDGNSTEGIGVDIIKGSFVLNGGTIRNNSATSGAGVTVQKDATFIMNGGTISNNTTTEYGAGVCALGSFTMNGGEISDNTATTQGGGVYVTASTFTMTGGTISDNTANKGGGVYVPASSTFTMQSGTISGNTATNAGTSNATRDSGGGVYVAADGTFNMNAPIEGVAAGIIKENIAQTNQFGAGVLVKGTFNMNAGTISNHGSENNPLEVEGTGVCLIGTSATLTMNGGEIKNNYSTKAGVGVSMRDGNKTGPVFTMNGGAITANHASGNDSNVGGIVVRYGVFEMNEGAVISNNTAKKLAGGMSLEGSANTTFIFNGGTFENNTAGTYGHDIYLTGVITLNKTLTSDVSISPNSYSETKVIAQTGEGISDEEFKASMKYLNVEDKNGHWFVNDEGILTKGPVVLQSTGVGYATLTEAIEAAGTGESISIVRDIEVANTIAITKELTITSATAITLTASDSLAGHVFDVTDGELTITGASENAKINLVAGTKTQALIRTNGGDATITNVELNGHSSSTVTNNAGRGIYNESGTVAVNSVTIQNMVKGDGIYIKAGAILNLDNVMIDGVGRYGIKTYGTVNIYNTIQKAHALTIQNTTDHGIDIDSTGKVKNTLTEVPDNTYAIKIQTTTKETAVGVLVRAGGYAEMSSLSVKNTQRQGVYFLGSSTKTASGSISDFEVSGTGLAGTEDATKEGAVELKYSTATLTNGTITSGTYCIKTDANSTLTTSEVKVKATGSKAALFINGSVVDKCEGVTVLSAE